MKRRDFLRAASVPAATATASAAAGVGAAQEGTSTSDGTGTAGTGAGTGTGGAGTGTGGGGGGGGGGSETVEVGPGGDLVFSPGTDEALQIAPGTTVEFVWGSDNHNIVVDSQPDGSNWSGHETLENEGFTYTHTFDTLGTYEYYCEPHETAGMVGTVEVVENPSSGGGGEKDLEELGVPIQAHWVGAATILGIVVTAIFTFYILKYGESAHTGTGRNG